MDDVTRRKWDKVARNFEVMAGYGPEKRWAPYKEELFGKMGDGNILFLALGTGLDIPVFPKGKNITAIDISQKMIDQAQERLEGYDGQISAQQVDVHDMPFEDNSFDLVISITTVHNLEGDDLIASLREIMRVSRGGAFITVDAYRNDEEKEAMFAWNLTAKTILHVDEWREVFDQAGYTGDYYWFMP